MHRSTNVQSRIAVTCFSYSVLPQSLFPYLRTFYKRVHVAIRDVPPGLACHNAPELGRRSVLTSHYITAEQRMALAIRDVREHDLDAVLALNNTAGRSILALDAERLRYFY